MNVFTPDGAVRIRLETKGTPPDFRCRVACRVAGDGTSPIAWSDDGDVWATSAPLIATRPWQSYEIRPKAQRA